MLHPKLSLDTESPFQFVLTKIKNKAAQDTLVSLASSIETGCTANFALSTSLVYMTVYTNQRLKFLERTPHTCTSHRNPQDIAHCHSRPQCLVKFWGSIYTTVVGGNMNHKHSVTYIF